MTAQISLESKVNVLAGVGEATAAKLAQLGIYQVQDLLLHLPLRYEDKTKISTILSLKDAQYAQVEAMIDTVQVVYRPRRTLLVNIADGSSTMRLRFFYFSKAQQLKIANSKRIRAYGLVRKNSFQLEMVHPSYQLSNKSFAPLPTTLNPIYPSTAKLGQRLLQNLINAALELLKSKPLEDYFATYVAAFLKQQANLKNNANNLKKLKKNVANSQSAWHMDLTAALLQLHRPSANGAKSSANALSLSRQQSLQAAKMRLSLEELLAQRLVLRKWRQEHARQCRAPQIMLNKQRLKPFFSGLGFELTSAQQRVLEEIATDISCKMPTWRLLQGDVGSGKTVVAAAALIAAAQSNCQAALMAPTELLARQHFINLQKWCAPLALNLAFFSADIKAATKKQLLDDLASGSVDIAVGTHALFQKKVEFKQLGLLIVDEQHRFGVKQRLALQQKSEHSGKLAHQILMTATPIPRTLAMTAYADLDISIIDQLPPGRKAVTTVVMSEQKRDALIARIATACRAQKQVYWVCTLIDESEVLECQAAAKTTELLQQALPNLQIGLVHGQMKSAQKEQVMQKFKAGSLDILVATTVIEVGVDVPNASLMIIENAERLGLAQLHQLRGRVGRGAEKSACVLLYKAPLGAVAKQRLQIMRSSNDGFYIAEQDLLLRGHGEILGTAQSGDLQFKVADLNAVLEHLPSLWQVADFIEYQQRQIDTGFLERWVKDKAHFIQV